MHDRPSHVPHHAARGNSCTHFGQASQTQQIVHTQAAPSTHNTPLNISNHSRTAKQRNADGRAGNATRAALAISQKPHARQGKSSSAVTRIGMHATSKSIHYSAPSKHSKARDAVSRVTGKKSEQLDHASNTSAEHATTSDHTHIASHASHTVNHMQATALSQLRASKAATSRNALAALNHIQ